MPQLSESLITNISHIRKEPAWLLQWRLDAFNIWKSLTEPHWGDVDYSPIDYDKLNYYNEKKTINTDQLQQTYKKMGIPEAEQKALLGMATDTIIDSKSVNTLYSQELQNLGIIFLPFSEAVKQYPQLIKQYLGTIVPKNDNFFAALNSAVFSDGTFVYIPKNTKCPIDLASYFRIETANIGQFERTLIIAEKNSELSYLEGCSAPRQPNHQLHSGIVEIIVKDNACVKYTTIQNWYAGTNKKTQHSGVFNFVTKRGKCYNNAKLNWTQVEIGSAKTWKYPSTILIGKNSSSDFYSLSITRGTQQADTGTKMIHIGNNSVSNIISYGIAIGNSKQTFRSLVHFTGKNCKNASKCDTRIIGNTATTKTIPKIVLSNCKNTFSHEAKTGSIDSDTLLYLERAGISSDESIALIIGSLASPIISRLPMEFLVESKQLIKTAIEQ